MLVSLLLVVDQGEAGLPRVDDQAIKSFVEGPSELVMNYDGEPRKAVEKKYHMITRKLPTKKGSIVDGKMIPFPKE